MTKRKVSSAKTGYTIPPDIGEKLIADALKIEDEAMKAGNYKLAWSVISGLPETVHTIPSHIWEKLITDALKIEDEAMKAGNYKLAWSVISGHSRLQAMKANSDYKEKGIKFLEKLRNVQLEGNKQQG